MRRFSRRIRRTFVQRSEHISALFVQRPEQIATKNVQYSEQISHKFVLRSEQIIVSLPQNKKHQVWKLSYLYFSRHTFLDFVDDFYKMGGKHIFADEVHKYHGWSQELKNAYDAYPDMRFVITGSSILNILNSDADLSRRCINYHMQGLSFREYLHLCEGISFNAVDLPTLLAHPDELCTKVNDQCRPLAYFEKYQRMGYYPFVLEGEEDYYERIANVAKLILEIELPQLCGVDVANIRKLKSLLAVLASEYPMQLDMQKLSAMAGMSILSATRFHFGASVFYTKGKASTISFLN